MSLCSCLTNVSLLFELSSESLQAALDDEEFQTKPLVILS